MCSSDLDAEAVVTKFKAAQSGFSEALFVLSNNETMKVVAEAWSIQRVIGGDSVSDALSKVFAGSPLEGMVKKLLPNGQGTIPGRPTVPPPV